MKKKGIAVFIIMIMIIISLTPINYSATTTRGVLYLLNDGSDQAIEDTSIRVTQKIQSLKDKELLLRVEVENL